MTVTLKAHPFTLITPHNVQSMDQLLQQIHAQSLQDRTRTVFGATIKLESIIPPQNGASYWLLDFLKIRTQHAPGLVTKNTVSQSIPLQRGQNFSENTAALYCPAKNVFIIQYNHYGPRSGNIAEYLSIYTGQAAADYELRVKINQAAQARLQGKTQFTKLTFRVAPANISPAFKARHRSLASAIQHQQNIANGDWVELTFSVDARSGNSLRISNLIPGLKALAGQGANTVSSVQISGRNNTADKVDVVDLLKEKEEQTFKNLPLDHGGRIPLQERHNKLIAAYNGWVRSGII